MWRAEGARQPRARVHQDRQRRGRPALPPEASHACSRNSRSLSSHHRIRSGLRGLLRCLVAVLGAARAGLASACGVAPAPAAADRSTAADLPGGGRPRRRSELFTAALALRQVEITGQALDVDHIAEELPDLDTDAANAGKDIVDARTQGSWVRASVI